MNWHIKCNKCEIWDIYSFGIEIGYIEYSMREVGHTKRCVSDSIYKAMGEKLYIDSDWLVMAYIQRCVR